MKKILENAVLLVIAAALFLGVYSYIKASDDPIEDDEIVDVETDGAGEVELLELTIDCSFTGTADITIQYEEGMTWEEWINSEYNTFGFSLTDYQYNSEMVKIVRLNEYYLRKYPMHAGTLDFESVEVNSSFASYYLGN